MSQTVYVINGPNLNLLGQRQPEIYGHTTYLQLKNDCLTYSKKLGVNVLFFQTNAEHAIIDFIHDACQKANSIIINGAGYSHTSIAILDALNAFDGFVVEVHISDIYKRERFRHFSYISLRADKVIAGKGVKGYLLALDIASKAKR